MSMPMTGVVNQVGAHRIDQDTAGQEQIESNRVKKATKRTPGVQKQFVEPSDKAGDTPLRKNNFM